MCDFIIETNNITNLRRSKSMKKTSIENLQIMVEESNKKYAAKSALTALQEVVAGKADVATTLDGYGRSRRP